MSYDHDTNELYLTIKNEGKLYPQVKRIRAALLEQVAEDTYDSEAAIRAWLPLVRKEARADEKRWGSSFSEETEERVAELFAEDFEVAFETGEFDEQLADLQSNTKGKTMARKKKTSTKNKAPAKKKTSSKKKAASKKRKAATKKKTTSKKKSASRRKTVSKKKAPSKKKTASKKKATSKKKAPSKKKTSAKKKAKARKKAKAHEVPFDFEAYMLRKQRGF